MDSIILTWYRTRKHPKMWKRALSVLKPKIRAQRVKALMDADEARAQKQRRARWDKEQVERDATQAEQNKKYMKQLIELTQKVHPELTKEKVIVLAAGVVAAQIPLLNLKYQRAYNQNYYQESTKSSCLHRAITYMEGLVPEDKEAAAKQALEAEERQELENKNRQEMYARQAAEITKRKEKHHKKLMEHLIELVKKQRPKLSDKNAMSLAVGHVGGEALLSTWTDKTTLPTGLSEERIQQAIQHLHCKLRDKEENIDH